MSRSPLAYPLTRGIDGDSGGAADLQTDVMRFMAILSLCLVAIFALVQSLPMAPQAPVSAVLPAEASAAPVAVADAAAPAPAIPGDDDAESISALPATRVAKPATVLENVPLTRPKWTSTHSMSSPVTPTPVPISDDAPADTRESIVKTAAIPATKPVAASAPADQGFTLRFESDIALTRLVAAGQVGFYAIDANRAQRMAVSDSRISFWEASTPNAFHEMEAGTVPQAVVDALNRTGAEATAVNFGVTLPAKLSLQLDRLMSESSGGSLVIAADGNLRLEPS